MPINECNREESRKIEGKIPCLRSLLVLVVLFIFLASCATPSLPAPVPVQSPQAPGTSAEGHPARISFGIGKLERPLYAPLVAQFEERNPDVSVELVELDSLLNPVFGTTTDHTTARRVLSRVDTVVSSDIGGMTLPVDAVLNLQPFADADAAFDRNDFYPGTLEATMWENAMVMLPYAQWIPLVSYNKELLQQRGVPVPSPDWTWIELVRAASQIAYRRGEEQIYGYADITSFTAIRCDLLASGVPANEITAEAFRWTEPMTTDAIDRVVSLAQSGAFYVNERNTDTDVMREMIQNGNVGMWLNRLFAPESDDFRDWHQTFTIEQTLLPPPPAFAPTMFGYVISAGTQHPAAAWRWISFLSSQPAHGIFYPLTVREAAPVRRSIAAQAGYFEQFSPAVADALRVRLDQPRTTGFPESLPFRDPLRVVLEEAFHAVREDGVSAEQAVARAQASLDMALANMRATAAVAPTSGPFVVATSVAPSTGSGTTITVAAARSLDQGVRQATERFNANQTEVAATIEADANASTLADLTIGADCVAWPAGPTPDDIPALLDIQPFRDINGGDAGTLPPALLAPFAYQGQLLGLPLDVTLPTLGYQPERFTEGGAAAPTTAWTPAEFLAVAQQLTDKRGARPRYGYASASGDLSSEVRFWLARNGARLGVVQDGQLAATLTDPKTVVATQFILALLRETSPHTRLTGYSQQSIESDTSGQEAIAAGQVGLWVNQFNSGFDAAGAIAPVPLGSSGWSAEELQVSGLAIKVVTRHADACWAWMRTVQAEWSLFTSGTTQPVRFPALPAARTNTIATTVPATTELVQSYGATLDSTAAPLSAVVPSGLEPFWFYRAVDRALQGADLEQELAQAQTLTEQHIACVRGGQTPGRCARQVDSQYQGFSQE